MPQQPQDASPDGDIHVRIDPSPVVAEQVPDDTLAALAGEGPPPRYEPESGPPVDAGQLAESRRTDGAVPVVTGAAAEPTSAASQATAPQAADPTSEDRGAHAPPPHELPAEPAEDSAGDSADDGSPDEQDSRGAAIQADALAAGRRAAAQAQAIEASRRAAAQANAARAAAAPGDRDDAAAAALHGERRKSRDAGTDDTDRLDDTAHLADTDRLADPADTAPMPPHATAPRPVSPPHTTPARPVSPAPDLLPGFDGPHAGRTRRSRGDRPVAGLGRTRRPVVGLVALVVFGLVALFFGWVSADPFWLAVGRGTDGTVTVTRCDSGQCVGRFTTERFAAEGVTLSGVSPTDRDPGATVPGRMLASDRTWAYAGPAWGLHLRWGLGLAVVLLSGVGVALATGTRFLRPLGRRAATGARLLAVAGPLLLFAGMLGAALL